jgi:hypothetical protein
VPFAREAEAFSQAVGFDPLLTTELDDGIFRKACGNRRSDAAAQMVDVVLLCREHGPEEVELAVRGALTAGAIDGGAVAVLTRRADSPRPDTPAPLTDLQPYGLQRRRHHVAVLAHHHLPDDPPRSSSCRHRPLLAPPYVEP